MTRIVRLSLAVASAGLLSATAYGCADPVQPEEALLPDAVSLAAADAACWGQATRVFAMTGEMGEHASQQPTPRLGLANLARVLYDDGILPEPTMQALGAFVAAALGLSIDACM